MFYNWYIKGCCVIMSELEYSGLMPIASDFLTGHQIITKLLSVYNHGQWVFKSIALWQVKAEKVLDPQESTYKRSHC